MRMPPAGDGFYAVVRESDAIAPGAGPRLGGVGPLPTGLVARILARPWLARPLAWLFARGLRGTYCSMAGDLPAGRSEIDFYNRHLIGLSGDFPCPLNRLVLTLIQRIVARRRPPHPTRLESLRRRFC